MVTVLMYFSNKLEELYKQTNRQTFIGCIYGCLCRGGGYMKVTNQGGLISSHTTREFTVTRRAEELGLSHHIGFLHL